jgi:hypothetical protein
MNREAKGQILPVALVVGASLMIFALAMVSMLRSTARMTQRVAKGNQALFGADLALDKTINYLNTGAWGAPKEPFPFLTRYRGDFVHKDVRDTWYVVRVNPGNLVAPPGDALFERTVTVDALTFAPGQVPPAAPEPTPWTVGGAMPANVVNRRIIQAVVKRGSISNALTSRGNIDIGGSGIIYWGDVYCYMNTLTSPLTTISLDIQTQLVGPGYPEFHTETGCIKKQSGKGIGGGTYCQSDAVAQSFKYYPNDPNMPPEPIIDLPGLKEIAKKIYIDPSTGTNSQESGYFYKAGCAGCGTNSTGAGANEANHTYSTTRPMAFSDQCTLVLNRMRTNLAKPATWVGSDDLVFFIDTQDTQDLKANLSNMAIGNGTTDPVSGIKSIDFKGGGTGKGGAAAGSFQGFMIVQGSMDQTGSGGTNTPMISPGPEWLPPSPVTTENWNFNGFLYIGGNFVKYTGNVLVYGSIFCNGFFSSNGNITVYYRDDFNYGILARGSTGVTKWLQIKPEQFPANYYP